jgi:hypothetical protein
MTKTNNEDDIEQHLDALNQYEEYKKEVQNLFDTRSQYLPSNVHLLRKQYQNINLKSDLKKSTSFIKKIKLITTEGLNQCLRDIQTLNLTLYISEIISSIIESNIKPTDISNLIVLCLELYKRYSDFLQPFVTALKESILSRDEEIQKRKRVQIRILMELYQLGLFTEENFFILLLKDLNGKSYPKYVSSSLSFSVSVSLCLSLCLSVSLSFVPLFCSSVSVFLSACLSVSFVPLSLARLDLLCLCLLILFLLHLISALLSLILVNKSICWDLLLSSNIPLKPSWDIIPKGIPLPLLCRH